MLPMDDPHLAYVAASYGITAVALTAVYVIQRCQRRRTRRQLEHLKEVP